jgi:uncharacterized protein (DUF983 family)
VRRVREPARTDDSTPLPLTTARALSRGLRRRCPLCGDTEVFTSWFRMRDRCPRCNFPFERIEGHWLGALGMNTIVSFGTLLVVLAVGLFATYPDPPVWPLIGIGVAVAVVVPLLFFPVSKTLWSAIDLLMRPLEPADDVDPRFIPPAGRSPRDERGR